jgi:multiple sugar transport system ATP-binding protein
MAEILLDDVSRLYPDGTAAVSHLTLRINHGELMAIVGPSGCGKSSLLRLIAGLDPLSGGSVAIGGRVVDHVPTSRRDVAMVFEAGALYPHLTARENVRYALDLRGLPEAEIDQRVRSVSRVLGLGRFLDRKPQTLSAGQRQRVAIGRTTVRTPTVFLLDEPLTHVDAGERIRLRTALAALQRDLGVTTIYVTHDQAQAMTIGDRVAVMRAGRIEQVDKPAILYQRPANAFVASFIGEPATALLAGWLETDADRAWVVLGNQRLPLPGSPSGELSARSGSPIIVGIRPEHVTDAAIADVPPAVLFSRASRVQHLGSHLLVGCPLNTRVVTVGSAGGLPTEEAGQATLTARFPPSHPVRAGDRVELAIDMAELSFFDPVTGEAISNRA